MGVLIQHERMATGCSVRRGGLRAKKKQLGGAEPCQGVGDSATEERHDDFMATGLAVTRASCSIRAACECSGVAAQPVLRGSEYRPRDRALSKAAGSSEA
jgi:hypothetical protein